MNETHVTVVGNLTADPIFRYTRGGDAFVTFRVAANERRRDADGNYVDGHTSFFSVTCFRALACNVQRSLGKGSRVVVSGRLRVKEWSTPERNGMSAEIDATAVGPDLTWGYADLTRGIADAPSNDRLDQDEIRAALAELEGRVDLTTGELIDPIEGDPTFDDVAAQPQPA